MAVDGWAADGSLEEFACALVCEIDGAEDGSGVARVVAEAERKTPIRKQVKRVAAQRLWQFGNCGIVGLVGEFECSSLSQIWTGSDWEHSC